MHIQGTKILLQYASRKKDKNLSMQNLEANFDLLLLAVLAAFRVALYLSMVSFVN